MIILILKQGTFFVQSQTYLDAFALIALLLFVGAKGANAICPYRVFPNCLKARSAAP